MSHLLAGILDLPPLLVLALVFLFPAVEASLFVGVVVPGEIGVILGGVLANQGKLPLAAVLIAAIAGAIIGDSVGYWVGDKWGEKILGKIPDRILDQQKLDKAKDAIKKYGARAVFIGRFTAALRAIVPGAAGMSGIHYGKFLLWNVLGGATWATAFVLLGYAAGSQYQQIEHYADYIGLGLLAAIIAFFVYRHFRSKKEGAGSATAG